MAKVSVKPTMIGLSGSSGVLPTVERQIARESLDTSPYAYNSKSLNNMYRMGQLVEQKQAIEASKDYHKENSPDLPTDKKDKLIEVGRRQDFYTAIDKQVMILDAQIADNKRQRYFGTLRSAYYSLASGVETMLPLARIAFQGEDTAQAYQFANSLMAYHEPTGAIDNLIQQAMANAIPMAAIIGATVATGGAATAAGLSASTANVLGGAVSFGLIGSQEGGSFYLDLRERGISKETATATAVLGGLAIGALEMYTGKLLGATFGKIPGAGKLVGEVDRVARFKALSKLGGKTGDLKAVYRASGGKAINVKELNDALKAAFGSSTGRVGAILDMARQSGTEAVTGGFEELFQSTVQMVLGQHATEFEGLESYLPTNPDGTLDETAILNQLGEAFAVGMMLEGAMGAAATLRSAKSRIGAAEFMENVKNGLRNTEVFIYHDKEGNRINDPKEISRLNDLYNESGMTAVLNEEEGTQHPTDRWATELEAQGLTVVETSLLDQNSLDFVSRYALMQSIMEERKAIDKSKVDELPRGQRRAIWNNAIQDGIGKLVQDPMGSIMLSYGDIALESYGEGHMSLMVGGRKVNVVLSKNIPQGQNAMWRKGAGEATDIGVTRELWDQMVHADMDLDSEDFIAINLNRLSTFPHEVMHAIVKNLPETERNAALSLVAYDGESIVDSVPLNERLSDDFAMHIAEKTQTPYQASFMNAMSRAEVAMFGRNARQDSQRRVFHETSLKAIGTASTVPNAALGPGVIGGIGNYGRKKVAEGIQYAAERVAPPDAPQTTTETVSEPEAAPAKPESKPASKTESKIPSPFAFEGKYQKPIKSHSMRYNMPASQNVTGKNTTTLALAKAGKRTSTTRSYRLGEPGDIITFETDPQQYMITGAYRITSEHLSNQVSLNQLSESEGWTKEAILGRFKNQIKPGAWVTLYKRFRATAKTQTKQPLIKSKSKWIAPDLRNSKAGDAKAVSIINKVMQRAIEGKGAEPFTQAQANKLAKEINAAYSKVSTPLLEVVDAKDIDELLKRLDDPRFADVLADIREVFLGSTADVRARKATAERIRTKGPRDLPGQTGLEVADIAHAEQQKEYIESLSTRPEEVKINIKAPIDKAMSQIGKQKIVDAQAYIPLDETTYNEAMSILLDAMGFDSNQILRDSGGFTNSGFAFPDFTQRAIYGKMTDLFGPAWPLLIHASKLTKDIAPDNSMHQIANLLKTSFRTFVGSMTSKHGTLKNPTIVAGAQLSDAWLTVQPFSADKIQIGDKKESVWLTPKHIVQAFKAQGLPSDGSFVSVIELGSDTTKATPDITVEELRDQVQKAIKTDMPFAETEDSGSDAAQVEYSTIEGFNTIIKTELTAEQATREVLRMLTQAWNPYLAQGDIWSPTNWVKTKRSIQKGPKLGIHHSPQFILRHAINRKNVRGDLASLKTAIAYSDLGEAMASVLAQYKDVLDHLEGDTPQDIAIQDTLAAEPQMVVDLLTAVADELKKIDPIEADSPIAKNTLEVGRLISLVTEGRGTKTSEAYEEIERVIEVIRKADPEFTALNSFIAAGDTSLNKVSDYMFQDKNSIANRTVMAQNMNKISDQMNGLKDARVFRLQLDMWKLTDKWNKIFGMNPINKFRDILGMVAKGVSGKDTPYAKRQMADQYALAARFALENVNQPENADILRTSLESKIEALGKKTKLTIHEKFVQQKYNEYLDALMLADNILTGEDPLNVAVKKFIFEDYKDIADAYWENLGMEKISTGEKEMFYTPWMFSEPGTTSQQDGDNYTLYQLVGRMIGRKRGSLAEHFAEGKLFLHDSLLSGFMAAQQQNINAISSKDFINLNVRTGNFKTKPTPGYRLLEAGGSKYTLWSVVDAAGNPIASNIENLNEALSIAKDTKGKTDLKRSAQNVYAPEAIASYVNRITRNSALRETPFGSALMATNAKLKMLKVAWGMFHRRAFIWSSQLAGPAPVGYDWKNPNHSFWQKFKKRFDYIGTRDYGMEQMKQNAYPLFALAHHGLTTFRRQDIGMENIDYKTVFDKWAALQPKNAFTAASRATLDRLSWITDQLQTELFGVLGGSLKNAVAMRELQQAYDKNFDKIAIEKEQSRKDGKLSEHGISYLKTFPDSPNLGNMEIDWHSDTEVEILRSVAGEMNADFGGLHLKRLGITSGEFDVARLMFLGPDWTLSNFLTVSKLFKNPSGVSEGAGAITSGSTMEQQMYFHFWARIVGRAAAVTMIINLVMAGFDDEDSIERYTKALKAGKFKALMADISPLMHAIGGDKRVDHYLNVPGAFMDPLKWAFDPVRSVINKGSSVSKPLVSLISGTNYRHQRPSRISQIGAEGLYSDKSYRRGPPSPSEIPAWGIQEMLNIAPIQFQKLFALLGGEENIMSAILESGIGLDINQTYPKGGTDD